MDAWLTERYQALTEDITDSFLDIVECKYILNIYCELVEATIRGSSAPEL